MKAALGMPKGLTGVYITKTEPMFEASRILQQGDVLCSFNGMYIVPGVLTCLLSASACCCCSAFIDSVCLSSFTYHDPVPGCG